MYGKNSGQTDPTDTHEKTVDPQTNLQIDHQHGTRNSKSVAKFEQSNFPTNVKTSN